MSKKTSIVVTEQAYKVIQQLPSWIKKGRFLALILGWEVDDIVLFLRPNSKSEKVKADSKHIIQACKDIHLVNKRLYNRGINY